MTIKQVFKAIFSADSSHYSSLLGEEESGFWEMPCQHTLWGAAWRYKPRYKGLYWLARVIFVRMILPYMLIMGGFFIAVILALYLVISR